MAFSFRDSSVLTEGTPPEMSARRVVNDIDRNRAAWERWAPGHFRAGRQAWEDEQLRWGMWGTLESEVRLLKDLEAGSDVVELGCGTAAISAALARQGFRPIGVDFVRAQLETAARFQQEFGLGFGLLCANVEMLHYDQASFDLAVSDYGASLWCDPRRWLPEAHRVLRPRGRLIFTTHSALLMACTPTDGGPAAEWFARDYFSPYRLEFPGEDAVEFHFTHGQWVETLRTHGFVLDDLIEVQPPPGAEAIIEFASLDWARRWPSEDIWVAHKSD